MAGVMWVNMLWYFNQCCELPNQRETTVEDPWGRAPGRLPTAQAQGPLPSGFPVMPTVLFPAGLTVGPLPALGLQGFVRDGPALAPGPHSTPTSFSSSSSTDGDLDFQISEGSQGRRPGKGELAGLRLGINPGKGQEASQPTVVSNIS